MASGATGTPSTNISIPKINPTVDAAAATGVNSIVDFLDSYLQTQSGLYVPKTLTTTTGDIIYASGANTPARLGIGSSADVLTVAGGVPTWAAPAVPATVGYGTSLPGSPSDTDEYILVDSTTAATYQWRFRYNSSNAGSYKWEFVGGSKARSWVETNQGTTSTSFTDLSTAQSITVPRAGYYLVEFNCTYVQSTAAHASVGIKVGSASVATSDFIYFTNAGGGWYTTGSDSTVVLAAASDALKMQYKADSGTATFEKRNMLITPIQVA